MDRRVVMGLVGIALAGFAGSGRAQSVPSRDPSAQPPVGLSPIASINATINNTNGFPPVVPPATSTVPASPSNPGQDSPLPKTPDSREPVSMGPMEPIGRSINRGFGLGTFGSMFRRPATPAPVPILRTPPRVEPAAKLDRATVPSIWSDPPLGHPTGGRPAPFANRIPEAPRAQAGSPAAKSTGVTLGRPAPFAEDRPKSPRPRPSAAHPPAYRPAETPVAVPQPVEEPNPTLLPDRAPEPEPAAESKPMPMPMPMPTEPTPTTPESLPAVPPIEPAPSSTPEPVAPEPVAPLPLPEPMSSPAEPAPSPMPTPAIPDPSPMPMPAIPDPSPIEPEQQKPPAGPEPAPASMPDSSLPPPLPAPSTPPAEPPAAVEPPSALPLEAPASLPPSEVAPAQTPAPALMPAPNLVDPAVSRTSRDAVAVRTQPVQTQKLLTVASTAARIGDEIITLEELSAAVKEEVRARTGDQAEMLSKAERRELNNMVAASILNRMIDQALVIQEANRKWFKKAEMKQKFDEEIDKEWKTRELAPLLRNCATNNVYELKAKLAMEGKSYDALKQQFRKNMLFHEFLRSEIRNKVTADLPEMKAYYNEHRKDFEMPARITWRDIEINMAKYPGRAAARKKADEALARLLHNEDFDAVARSVSNGPTANKGGLYPDMQPGGYGTPIVNDELDRLPIGQVSQVLEAPNSFHIVRVDSRREKGPLWFDEVQDKIRNIVLEQNYRKAVEDYLAKLRANTLIKTMFDKTASDPELARRAAENGPRAAGRGQ